MRAASLIFPKDCKGDALQAPQCTRAGLAAAAAVIAKGERRGENVRAV